MADAKKVTSPSRIPRLTSVTTRKVKKESVSAGKKMPSPKQVRLTATKSQMPRNEAKAFLKPPVSQLPKKSPLREIQAKNPKSEYPLSKTLFNDRRGISEIRRSEKNLRVALEKTEQTMSSLKEDLRTLKRQMKEKDQEIENFASNMQNLQENLRMSENQCAVQAEVLETMNICPVTGARLENSKNFDAALDKVTDKAKKSVELLLDKLNEIDI